MVHWVPEEIKATLTVSSNPVHMKTNSSLYKHGQGDERMTCHSRITSPAVSQHLMDIMS